MDLRWRLLGSLGLLLTVLVLMAMAINLYSLKGDIRNEIAASENLASVLLEAGRIAAAAPAEEVESQLETLLSERPLRHLVLATAGQRAVAKGELELSDRIASLLGLSPSRESGENVRLGGQVLRIAANPASEIDERLAETARLCVTLIFFSGATLVVAWWSAHRALTPVRELEEGIRRLARGEKTAELPAFALKEFRRVATAIDQLAAALAASHAAKHHLARQLITVREEERAALARELHDEMGQTLTAISVTAGYLELHGKELGPERVSECARELRRDVKAGREQLRTMLRSLRPHGLDAAGLRGALEELIEGWRQRVPGLAFRLELPGRLPEISEVCCLTLYRVIQEALTNAVRHSQGSQCILTLACLDSQLHLSVVDDGRGPPFGGLIRGSGLLGMEERLAIVGGALRIDAVRPHGLALHMALPLCSDKETL